jgi:hypothetical protein
MIVAFSSRASKNIGHYAQARESIAGSFGGSFDLGLRGPFRDCDTRLLLTLWLALSSGLVGNELLLDFVGM